MSLSLASNQKMPRFDTGVRRGLATLEPKQLQQATPSKKQCMTPSPSVRIAAARAAARLGEVDAALGVLQNELQSDHQWGRLAAAIVLDEMNEQARPAIGALEGALQDQPNKYIVRVANRAINELNGTNHKVP